MTNPPPRIYHWLSSQLSIARFAGSIRINGVTYIVATHEEGQPLVRQDVLAAEAKDKKERRSEEMKETGMLFTSPWVWVVDFKVLSTTGRPA